MGDHPELFVHGVAARGVVDEKQRRFLSAQIVQPFAQPAEEERGSELPIAKRARFAMQLVERLHGDEQGNDEDDRNCEEAQNEPRAQGHFRSACDLGGPTTTISEFGCKSGAAVPTPPVCRANAGYK